MSRILKIFFQSLRCFTVFVHTLSLLFLGFNMLVCQSVPKKKDILPREGWVKGEGRAQIYQNDASLAKDRALRMAKKDAVRRKLGELIKSKTITESGVWVKGELSAQSEGLVRDYEIQSDHSFRDYYEIKILADVSQSELVDEVQSLLDDWEKPVIFGVVSETFVKTNHDPYSNNTLQALEEFFINQGFLVNKISSMQTALSPPISTSKIMKIIKKKKIEPDFDLLVFGKTTCLNAGKINYGGVKSNMSSAQLNTFISIFDIHTHRLIASASEIAAYPHIHLESACSNGIAQKVVPKLASKLFKQMLKKWGKEYGSGKSFFLDIEGRLPYKKLYKFQIILKNEIRGVVDIIERKVAPKKNSLEVVYQGKVKDFMEELMNKETNLLLKLKYKQGRKLFFTLK